MRVRTPCTSTPLTSALSLVTISPTAFPSAASPSRALRSLPLSVMMSGYLTWNSGNLTNRGTYGNFWSSMSSSYANSRYLYFNSTLVSPKNGYYKSNGFTLRCVARNHPKSPPLFHLNNFSEVRSALQIPLFLAPFLPELSAASLFRL